MSLSIQQLTRRYGSQLAVDGISLEVSPGQILGFLGPNGAGKSTTMKVATGYIPPTSGKVRVAGHDVTEAPIEAKRAIGYLPEHNPLYLDMYVRESLRFSGRTYGLGGNSLTGRIEQVIEQTGLGPESHKRIAALSKGYRQRVGLAQALLHDPPVLILDEPTTGLDPNQIESIRSLIRQVGQAKTVILSTHILQEVQAICTDYTIIHKGRLVGQGVIGKRSGPELTFELEVSGTGLDQAALQALPHVRQVRTGGRPGIYRLELTAEREGRAEVIRFCADHGIDLRRLQPASTDLAETFRQVTLGNTPAS